jgi:hypothetical protein
LVIDIKVGLMKHLGFSFFLCLLVLGITACDANRPVTGTAIFIEEQDPGTDRYKTRMVSTERYLRIDDGEGSKNYLLFDRKKSVIYSVNAIDSRILIFRGSAREVESPIPLSHEVKQHDDSPPSIEGRPTIHYSLFTNGEKCYDLFAVKDLLQDVTQSLIEFNTVLSYQQAVTLQWTPPEMLTPCSLANTIFLPARHLQQGFPIRLVDMRGKYSELINYQKKFKIDPELFQLPETYQRMELEEIQGK